jgi:hypothetical protein
MRLGELRFRVPGPEVTPYSKKPLAANPPTMAPPSPPAA